MDDGLDGTRGIYVEGDVMTGGSGDQIRQQAARTYESYQKISERAALQLFATGWQSESSAEDGNGLPRMVRPISTPHE